MRRRLTDKFKPRCEILTLGATHPKYMFTPRAIFAWFAHYSKKSGKKY
jgi:hypothetical protein